MRSKKFIESWQGIGLMMVGCLATIYLGVTQQLTLYIHPRYVIFTLILCTIGLAMVVLRIIRSQDDNHGTSKISSIGIAGLALVVVVAAICLLVIRPVILTSSAVSQRGINGSVSVDAPVGSAVPLFGSNDYGSLSVKNWSALLSQTSDISFFDGKKANIVGFVSPDKHDPRNVFFVSRFVITCCTVDAQPIGVPVYEPNWQSKYPANTWVRVSGSFAKNQSTKSQPSVAITDATITVVEQPKDPYEH